MVSRELDCLLSVLDERGLALSRDDVAQAFEDPETAADITAWVKEYLSPHNLLTKEELHFTEHRGRSRTKHDADSAKGRPLEDAEFETAISSLEASTAAIEKQCRMLEAQRSAFEALKARHSSGDGGERKDPRQQTILRRHAQLDFDVDELSKSLTSRIQVQIKQSNAAVFALPESLERALDKDDRLLDGLQKLLPKLSMSSQDVHSSTDVDELCQALTLLSGRMIRARIDAAYRQGVDASPAAQSKSPHEDGRMLKQRDELKAELHELSGEIDGLLSMAVENQYRTPITRNMDLSRLEAENELSQMSEYMTSTLQYLSARLDALEEHCQHMHAHDSALKQVSTTFESIITTNIKPKAPPASLKSPMTPPARGLKPLRLVQANLSESQDPATQLLRQYDVRISDSNDTAKLTSLLAQVDRERSARLSDLATSTETGMVDQMAETMAKTESDVQDLLAAVLSHSEYGKVRLIDEKVQADLDGLEAKTQVLGEEMRKLDVDGISKNVRAKQKALG